MADQEEEHQRETEGLLDIIRELRKELLLDTLLIDSFIPPEFQVSIVLLISPLTPLDSLSVPPHSVSKNITMQSLLLKTWRVFLKWNLNHGLGHNKRVFHPAIFCSATSRNFQ